MRSDKLCVFFFIFFVFCLFGSFSYALRLSSKNGAKVLKADEEAKSDGSEHEELEKAMEKVGIKKDKETTETPLLSTENDKTEEIESDEHLTSLLEQMSETEGMQKAFERLADTITTYTQQRLEKNPDAEFDEKEVEELINREGFGVFLQEGNRAEWFESIKNAYNKVKDFANKGFKKLKGWSAKALSGVKNAIVKHVAPLAKKLLSEAAPKYLPQIEQIVADSLKKLKPAVQKVIAMPVLSLFNKFEQYVGKDVPDEIFFPEGAGGERVAPKIETDDDVLPTLGNKDEVITSGRKGTKKKKKAAVEEEEEENEDEGTTGQETKVTENNPPVTGADAPPDVQKDWAEALTSIAEDEEEE